MIVRTLLSPTISPIQVGDAVGQALFSMSEHGVEHLPVVSSEGQLLALVSESNLREQSSPDTPLLSLLGSGPLFVTQEAHVFDAAQLMLKHNLSVLPVATAQGEYIGLVIRSAVFGQLAHMLATEESGAIVVIEASMRDFSLAKLAHVVEQNDVRILSVSTEEDVEADVVRATLKLNVSDTARVRHLMEHLDYRIIGVFDELEDDIKERVEEFMRYLEV
ncbi:MAG: CBS domain-containing protein [Rubricoccaceae bacterium]|nr:CBS domain-containing protein [Rubricoccaceae bacterium]